MRRWYIVVRVECQTGNPIEHASITEQSSEKSWRWTAKDSRSHDCSGLAIVFAYLEAARFRFDNESMKDAPRAPSVYLITARAWTRKGAASIALEGISRKTGRYEILTADHLGNDE